MSNEKDKQEDKTPEQILTEWSPRPETGYHSSWLIPAMKEYADQQTAKLRSELAKQKELNAEFLLLAKAIVDNSNFPGCNYTIPSHWKTELESLIKKSNSQLSEQENKKI